MRHHYIPEFYLKRWAVLPGKQLVEFQRHVGKVKPHRKAPKGTGYVHGLYELRGYAAEEAQQIEERFFRPADSEAADALDLIERDGNAASWSVDLRSAWTRFVVSLLIRCPEDVEAFRVGWRTRYEAVSPELEARYQAIRKAEDPPTLFDYIMDEPDYLREATWGEALMHLVDNPSLGAKFNELHWRVIHFPPDARELLTSDRPVIRTNGLQRKGGHFALAIGPRCMFLAAPELITLSNIEGADRNALAEENNRQVVSSAVKYVYGTSDAQLRFVQNRMGTVRQSRLLERIAAGNWPKGGGKA